MTYGPAGVSRRIPTGLRHAVFFLRCLAGAWHSDLVLAQDTVSAGLPALLAARLFRRPFVVRVPGDYAWEQGMHRFGVTDEIERFQERRYGIRTEALRRIQRQVVARADAVITPSMYFKGIVTGWIGRADTIHVVYGGIELGTSEGPSPAASPEPSVLTAARLIPLKGIAALVTLIADHPEWRLVVVGDGPQSAELRALATRLGAPVVFTGALPRAELRHHLDHAGVFVLNATSENFPHQVLEAMHAGVPVVATRVGGLPELVEDGWNGILVPPGDTAHVAAAIQRVLGDAELRTRIVRNAKVTAARFPAARTVDGVIEVCRAALARRRGGPARRAG